MGSIEIQFEEVMHLSKQFSDIAAELKNGICEKLSENLYREKAVWKGDASDLMTRKEVRYNEELYREAFLLQDLANKLENKAKEMYCAESVNRMFAQTRIYI